MEGTPALYPHRAPAELSTGRPNRMVKRLHLARSPSRKGPSASTPDGVVRWSASDDNGTVRGRFCEWRQISRIAGQDPVACAGQQYDGCVNRIAGASQAQQDTGLPAVLGTDRAGFYRAQQLGQDGLRSEEN